MNVSNVIQVVGRLLVFLAFAFLIPAVYAYYFGEDEMVFVESFGITFFTGLILYLSTRSVKLRFSPKDGFAIVVMCWFFICIYGSLPLLLADLGAHSISVVDALFESTSGFTTTGATILSSERIDALPKSLNLWRCLMHWLGGMGIIVLFLAILPALGAGGFQLYRAEIPGPSKDKFSPKIADTAKKLWYIYLGLTAIMFCAYLALDMSVFDAVCHAFSTVATGGFSSRGDSIAAFGSWKIDMCVIFFMFLGGLNFQLYYRFLTGRWNVFFKNGEFRFFVLMIAVTTAYMTYQHMVWVNPGESLLHSLRMSGFQVMSIITTTGFATDDYTLWPLSCQFMIVILMFTGACAGSTCGGIKVFRILLVIKIVLREIYQLIRPRAVLPIKMDGQSIGDGMIRIILGFVSLYFLLLGVFSFIVIVLEGSNQNADFVNLISISIACVSNIGPALGDYGPMSNYHSLGDATKVVLSLMMLLGRLELYSLLVLFHRDFWRN